MCAHACVCICVCVYVSAYNYWHLCNGASLITVKRLAERTRSRLNLSSLATQGTACYSRSMALRNMKSLSLLHTRGNNKTGASSCHTPSWETNRHFEVYLFSVKLKFEFSSFFLMDLFMDLHFFRRRFKLFLDISKTRRQIRHFKRMCHTRREKC